MSDTQTFMPETLNLSSTSGSRNKATVRLDANEHRFSTECRAKVFLVEDDLHGVPVRDIMATQSKRTQGSSVFKTHEQFKRELFGD